MITPYNGKYQDPQFNKNPSDDIDPKIKQGKYANEKDKEIAIDYYLRKVQYIYNCYLRDDAYVGYSRAREYRLNRMYAQGRQPVTKYINQLTIKDKKTNQRKGWMNISWDIVPILPKFRSIVRGKFDDIDYATYTRAIDEGSSRKREDIKLGVLVQQKYQDLLAEFKDIIGVDPSDDNENAAPLPFVPNSIEEYNMLSQMGAFKLAWEVSMDKLNNDTAAKCNWRELKDRLIEDAIDCGDIAIIDYHDPQTNKPMCDYVDPETLVVRQVRRNDYYDITEWGRLCWYTVEQLRSYGFDETQLQQAAAAYNSMWGNPTLLPGGSPYQQLGNRIDSFRIAVLDCEFQSFDSYFYETRNIDGREVVFDSDYGKKATNPKNKITRVQKPKFYRAKWVVGTDIIFDYGLQFDVPYDQYDRPKASLSLYRIAERSMMNMCMSVADDIQIAILKLRAAVADARPPGLKIEIGSISNVTLSGQQMTEMEVITIAKHRGDVLYKASINPATGMVVQGSSDPITEFKGGIGPYLDELLKTLEFGINMIRENTGINQITDASAPQSGALVGTAKIAEAGTNHALRPILQGYRSLKQRVFENITNRWQITAQFYAKEAFVDGYDSSVEIIRLGSDVYKPVFAVHCDALIADEDKIALENACLASMQAAKTGSVGITLMDYFYIRQLVASGNVRWAWIYLAYREKKMEEQKNAATAAIEKQRSDAVMAQDKQKHENAVDLIKVTEAEKRKTIILEKTLDRQNKLEELAWTSAKKTEAPKESPKS